MIIYIELYFKTYESDEVEAIIDQLHYAAIEKNYNFDVLKNFGEEGEIILEVSGDKVEQYYSDLLSKILLQESDLEKFCLYQQVDCETIDMVDYKDIRVDTKRIDSSKNRMVSKCMIRLCHEPTGVWIVYHKRHGRFQNLSDKAFKILMSKIASAQGKK
jgi:hypothetical protein